MNTHPKSFSHKDLHKNLSTTALARQIAEIAQGQHLCLLYENADEQLAAVVPYMAEGLRAGERCLYVADDRTVGEVRAALAGGGVDVEAECARGTLAFLTKRDSYLKDGRFEPRGMIDMVAELTSQATADGLSGLRVAGEMTWALGDGTDPDTLIEYEALLNDFFPQSCATGLCQYNKARFPPETLYDVLCTHPVAVIGHHVCPNHFFEPPRLVLDQSGKAERLEWRIAQLLRARAVEEALEEASQVKSDFLAAMSHDLRTPLNAILGYAELLGSGISGGMGSTQRRQLGRIEAGAKTLLGMIDELLSFARMEAGHEDVEPERVTLTRLVHEAVVVVRPAAEKKGLGLEVLVPHRRICLWTDKGKACKILLNLLSNAVKYSDRGRVTLAARVEGDGDGDAVLEVRDDGRGIAPDDLEKIFEPFWRVKGDPEQGTGLGLSVTRRLARLLGGDVTVASEPGVGSAFTVRLPLTYQGVPRG